jgi:carboxypeptidase Q
MRAALSSLGIVLVGFALFGFTALGQATTPATTPPTSTLLTSGSVTTGPAAEVAARIVGASLLQRGSYAFARSLCDDVGARQTGTAQALRAVAWAEAAMKRAGLQRVKREPVQVRHWERGAISLVLRGGGDAAVAAKPSGALPAKPALAADQTLAALALGGSVATPAEGIEADVVEVQTFAEIAALGPRAQGAFVFANFAMKADADPKGYGTAATLRWRGPSEAAKVGAAGFLFRSAGSGYHRLPHAGALSYQAGAPKIPAVALAAEDAELLHRRLTVGGKVRVHLKLEAFDRGLVPSFNVVGEIPGTSRKNEIVLLGAHLDSWDVGQGALDDAAGCAIALDTARLFTSLKLAPKRTVRVVLFMSEELDGAGARAYAEAHKDEIFSHVAALEADQGDGRPRYYGVTSGTTAVPIVKEWVTPLSALVPVDVRVVNQGGADLQPLRRAGVPVLEVMQDFSKYFEWHHTAGDTFDKIDADDLAIATATFANLTWAAASSSTLLPRGAPEP